MNKRAISLFSGIGGDTLAAEWAGFDTILLCEIDKFCQQVLRKNFPGVPLIEDVRNVTRESVITNTNYQREQQSQGCEQNIGGRTIDRNQATASPHTTSHQEHKRGCGSVVKATKGGQCGYSALSPSNQSNGFSLTLLTAGVPCQPASTAGKRRGKADDRWLWPEAIRVLSELKPAWAVFENPAGIGSLGELGGLSEVGADAVESLSDREAVELSNICRDIETHGYEVQSVCIPACAVGAPHRRDRIFIVCHTSECGLPGKSWGRSRKVSADGDLQPESSIVTDSNAKGLEIREGFTENDGTQLPPPVRRNWNESWIEVATRFCTLDARFSDGLAGCRQRNSQRVARLKALGNAIVPQQIYPILKAIADIEATRL